MTPPEAMLWNRLRKRLPGQPIFRRQHPIDPYVADFCCVEARLVIEVDGQSHLTAEAENRDRARDRAIMTLGFAILRIPALEVLRDPDGVADRIVRSALARTRGVGL
ncbi:endonuclease domain-containing protein [Brevundimonas balnearis]